MIIIDGSKGCFIETEKDIEIVWPSDDAVRLANAIFHTYKLDKYKSAEIEVSISAVCKLFGKDVNEESVTYIATLVDEILGEPVAVINKTLDGKLIEWKSYDFFTLEESIKMGTELISLKINLDYLRITEEFVANPYLEF